MSRKQSSTKWTTHFEFRGRILCLLTRVQRRESLVLKVQKYFSQEQSFLAFLRSERNRHKSSHRAINSHVFFQPPPTQTAKFSTPTTRTRWNLQNFALSFLPLFSSFFSSNGCCVARRQRRENFIHLREKEIDPQEEEKIRGNRAQKSFVLFRVHAKI